MFVKAVSRIQNFIRDTHIYVLTDFSHKFNINLLYRIYKNETLEFILFYFFYYFYKFKQFKK